MRLCENSGFVFLKISIVLVKGLNIVDLIFWKLVDLFLKSYVILCICCVENFFLLVI